MTERFQKAYNALIDAYFNGTLEKGRCNACVVGNICLAAGIPKAPITYVGQNSLVYNHEWNRVFYTNELGTQCWVPYKLDEARELFEPATGYTMEELAKIEFAFETNSKINYHYYSKHTEQEILEDQFNGLQAVIDIMIELDNIKEGQQYKDKFKQHPKLIHS